MVTKLYRYSVEVEESGDEVVVRINMGDEKIVEWRLKKGIGTCSLSRDGRVVAYWNRDVPEPFSTALEAVYREVGEVSKRAVDSVKRAVWRFNLDV